MAKSSILGGEHLSEPIAGKGTDSLGPSDNSDSGSDSLGAYGDGEMASDSDAAGTGERASIEGMDRSDRDILPDHVELEPDASAAQDLSADVIDVENLALDDEPQDTEDSSDA